MSHVRSRPQREQRVAPCDRYPHHAHRRNHRPDQRRRLDGTDRSHVRSSRSEVQVRLGRVVAQARRTRSRGVGPPSIDAVLLTHDHNDDNLDPARHALLPAAGVVITTAAGAKRLGAATVDSSPGRQRGSKQPGGRRSRSRPRPAATAHRSATRSRATLSASRFAGTARSTVPWISGDTVLYDGVRDVADRLAIGTAILHLGGVQFPVTGPVRFTMTARDAVELCDLIRPSTAIPIHYEGWKHFKQGRVGIERGARACARGHPRAVPLAAYWHRSRNRCLRTAAV